MYHGHGTETTNNIILENIDFYGPTLVEWGALFWPQPKDSRVGSKCKFEVTWLLTTAESQILVCPKTASHPHPSPDRRGKGSSFYWACFRCFLLSIPGSHKPFENISWTDLVTFVAGPPSFQRLARLHICPQPLPDLHLHPLDLDCNSGTVPPLPIPFSFHLSMLADFLP